MCIRDSSLGVQSLDSGILHLLGREHTPAQALHSVEMLKNAGTVSYTHLDVYKRQIQHRGKIQVHPQVAESQSRHRAQFHYAAN